MAESAADIGSRGDRRDDADGTPLESVAAGAVTLVTLGVAFGLLALGNPFFWVAFPVGFGGGMPLAMRRVRVPARSRTEPAGDEPREQEYPTEDERPRNREEEHEQADEDDDGRRSHRGFGYGPRLKNPRDEPRSSGHGPRDAFRRFGGRCPPPDNRFALTRHAAARRAGPRGLPCSSARSSPTRRRCRAL